MSGKEGSYLRRLRKRLEEHLDGVKITVPKRTVEPTGLSVDQSKKSNPDVYTTSGEHLGPGKHTGPKLPR